ncbi:MAG: PQQ-binding-like beta-propeller repeat protein, partial [Acidobacteriota bacterium]
RDQFGDGPRSTPTVHGDRVYAVSAFGKLWAADRERGRALWHHDLRERFGAVVPTWGVSTAPVVVDDLLLLNVGGKPGHALMAFDAGSGEVRWSVESGIPGYALPITYTALGQRQTVFFTGKRLIAIDPADGRTLWTRAWKTAYDVNAAAPIFLEPDRLFVSSGYDTGASLFQLEREDGELGVRELWRSRKMKNQFSASVYHDGHFYGFDNKNLRCLDAASGEVAWTTKGFGHGSLMLVDGHLVILGERGKLALAEASAKGYRELWTHSVARGKHWTVPTLYAGRLYIRNEKELMAFAPAAPAGASG